MLCDSVGNAVPDPFSEYVVGNKVTVGAPFYNRVAVPIGLFLLFLTGVGPLLPWRATSLKSIKRNFVLPVIALWATVIVCLAVGVNPWKGGRSLPATSTRWWRLRFRLPC